MPLCSENENPTKVRRTTGDHQTHPTVPAQQNFELADDHSHASHSPHTEAPIRPSHPMITESHDHRAKSGIFKPKVYIANTSSDEPYTYDEAAKDKNWKAAIDEEYNVLIKNKTEFCMSTCT